MSATWREQDGPWRHCRRRSESLARAGVARHHRLSRHPRFYPHVAAADVVEMDERRAIVHYRVTVGPLSFGFYMEKYPDPRRRRVEWHLAEGRPHGPFRENSGYWQINSTDDGAASLVTYAIAVRTMLPASVTAGGENASLAETMIALRKLVEAPR